MQVESVPVASLIPDPGNARTHDAKNLEAIVRSLHRFGQRKPIVVTHAGVVIAGNGTLEAAKALGWHDIEISRAPKDWDDNTVRAYALADNQTAILADWDEQILKDTLYELEAEGWDITELGFDELKPPQVFHADPDEVPETPENPVSKRGDLYVLGDHRLLCGDSTKEADVKRLMDGELADLVFTDPPYGVSYTGGGGFAKDGKTWVPTDYEPLSGDDSVSLYEPCCLMAFAYSVKDAPLYLWHAGVKGIAAAAAAAAAAAGYEIRSEIVWNKNMAQFGALSAQYKQKHEPCYYCFKKGQSARWRGPTNEVTVWDVDRSSVNEFHPTQKPVSLATRAIGNHDCDIVLDLFGGSGSTMIACERNGKSARLMELSPAYVDVIVKRWETFTGKKAELLDTGAVDNGD